MSSPNIRQILNAPMLNAPIRVLLRYFQSIMSRSLISSLISYPKHQSRESSIAQTYRSRDISSHEPHLYNGVSVSSRNKAALTRKSQHGSAHSNMAALTRNMAALTRNMANARPQRGSAHELNDSAHPQQGRVRSPTTWRRTIRTI